MTTRHSPYSFRCGRVAVNRMVVPPMASSTADETGNVTPETLAHYRRLCEAGTGIVFVEYTYVHPSGRSELRQMGAWSWSHVAGLARLAATIRRSGALAGLQLVHAGGKTTSDLADGAPMGPSAIRVPVKGWTPDTPVPMNETDVENWMVWFVEAARRAAAAGFDLAEIHAAHGYGLNPWLSPLTNFRGDRFGGTLERRARLLFDIVDLIRTDVPEVLLAVRLPGQDHVPGGLTTWDTIWVAKQLEDLGVDLIDVSSGIGGWRRLDGRTHQGYLVEDAARIKSHVGVPVVGVGGIETGAFVDQIVGENTVDFAAVGRAILRDPRAWGLADVKPFPKSV